MTRHRTIISAILILVIATLVAAFLYETLPLARLSPTATSALTLSALALNTYVITTAVDTLQPQNSIVSATITSTNEVRVPAQQTAPVALANATFTPPPSVTAITPLPTPVTMTLSTVPLAGETTTINAYSVFGISDIWIAVGGDKVVHSGDGGRSWVTQYEVSAAQTENSVRQLQFTDARHGWIVTERNVLGTTDGGQSWQERLDLDQPLPITAGRGAASPEPSRSPKVYSIAFAPPLHGWVATSAGLLATADGGQSWSMISPIRRIYKMHFVDDRHGWGEQGYGAAPEVNLYTEDGGRNWRVARSEPSCQQGGERSYLAPATTWIVCVQPVTGADFTEPQYLKKSTDGGDSWQLIYSDEPGRGVRAGKADQFWLGLASLQSLFFLNDKQGWVSLGAGDKGENFRPRYQTILRVTTNGGRSWRTTAAFDGSELTGLQFVTSSIGYGVGIGGSVLFSTPDGGATWIPLYTPSTKP